MGWTYTYLKDTSAQGIKEYLKEYFDPKEVIDISGIRGGAIYAAINTPTSDLVCGNVILVRIRKGRFNFGYKVMGEQSWPYYYDCPKRILGKLSTIEDIRTYYESKFPENPDTVNEIVGNVKTWRQKCLDNAEKTLAATPKVGMSFSVAGRGGHYQVTAIDRRGGQVYCLYTQTGTEFTVPVTSFKNHVRSGSITILP